MTQYQQPVRIEYVAGVAGSDAEVKETRIGELVSFRLAVTRSYGEKGSYGETEWFDVMVKNEGLGQSVLREVYKGARVMAQGIIKVGEYNGKPQYAIWADRVALLDFLTRDQAAAPAAAASAAADDELGF